MRLFPLLLLALAAAPAWAQRHPAPPAMRYFRQAAPSPAGAVPYGNNPLAGHYAQAADAKIYYEVYGQGPPVLVLHGGVLGSTYELGQLIDSLSRRYRVIAVSTRGHGKSEVGTAPLTYEQRATDALAALDAVTPEPALVLGFSDGAYAGYKLAALYPARVRKLVAIGAGELRPGPAVYQFSQQQALALDAPYWRQQQALAPEPQKLDAYLAAMGAFYSRLTVSKELFAQIRCPVLVLAGERDQNAHLPTVVAAYYMLPNSQLAIIPNATHTVFLDNFPAVWASVAPFLR